MPLLSAGPRSRRRLQQKRGGEAGMLFRDELEAVLARFNPWLSADAIRQLAVDRAEMGVDGPGADHQPFGDLRVGQPLRDQAQHLDLAYGQVDEGG